MQPTDEQRAILADGNRIIRINARAGTGKTSTLRMVAESNADKSILYLVFNKRTRREAEEHFPANVKVRTVHSLAYRHVGSEWKWSIGDFSPLDLLPAFRDRHDSQTFAGLAHSFLNFFLNSARGQLEDAVDDFASLQPVETRETFKRNAPLILDACRRLATMWYRGERTCPHDFYLKLFHKSGAFERVLNGFDMVLVDEAQDLSPVMVDALKRCRNRIVVVGDSHQQIYGFRHAVNAMSMIGADVEYELSMSFRFGTPIAELATCFIREAKEERGFRIVGNPEKTSTVAVSDVASNGDWTYLSRTNVTLFDRAVDLVSRGTGFRFERELEPTLWQVLDVHHLFSGRREDIRSEWIKSFGTFERLRDYSKQNEDFQLRGLCQVVERHHRRFPDVIFEIHRVTRAERDRASGGEVVLSTVHSAKGREYPRVMIDRDLADAVKAVHGANDSRTNEEINIAYVGFTRAMGHLVLPSAFLDVLGSGWRVHLSSLRKGTLLSLPRTTFEGTRPGGNSPPSVTRVVGKIEFGQVEKSSKSRKIRVSPSPGDRVETPHGTGTVVETEGDKCLVSLTGQDASVWEWARSLKVMP